MIELRKYCKEDGPAITELVGDVLRLYGLNCDPETDADLNNIAESYSGGIFKVLDDDGLIIGSYGLYKTSKKSCELRKMYLNKSYHGKGLGRLMMDDVFKSAQKLGFEEITLETNSCLEAAIKMYKKYGFKEYDPTHPISCRCDLVMRKTI